MITLFYNHRTIRYGSTLTAALYQSDVPYFTVILRKVFGVAGAAFVDNRDPNWRVAWPSTDSGSLPLEGGIYVSRPTYSCLLFFIYVFILISRHKYIYDCLINK